MPWAPEPEDKHPPPLSISRVTDSGHLLGAILSHPTQQSAHFLSRRALKQLPATLRRLANEEFDRSAWKSV